MRFLAALRGREVRLKNSDTALGARNERMYEHPLAMLSNFRIKLCLHDQNETSMRRLSVAHHSEEPRFFDRRISQKEYRIRTEVKVNPRVRFPISFL